MLGKALALQFKLQKHLSRADDLRVRDYMIEIRTRYPDFNQCPIDLQLLRRAVEFLRRAGWEIRLDKNVSPVELIRRSPTKVHQALEEAIAENDREEMLRNLRSLQRRFPDYASCPYKSTVQKALKML